MPAENAVEVVPTSPTNQLKGSLTTFPFQERRVLEELAINVDAGPRVPVDKSVVLLLVIVVTCVLTCVLTFAGALNKVQKYMVCSNKIPPSGARRVREEGW